MSGDLRAAEVFGRYIRIMNSLTQLDQPAFAQMLDSATQQEMDAHVQVVTFLEAQIQAQFARLR